MIQFMTEEERKLWKQAVVAMLRAGHSTMEAVLSQADLLIQRFRVRS